MNGDFARLIDTPGDPVPPDAEPRWITAADGLKLRAALFPATTAAPRGSVVLSGGRTEPIEKYFETIADFRRRGFAVLAHDWRGQGLSGRELPDPLKGHANGWRPFLDDYRQLLDAFEDRLPKPWIAVGHSMGGCLTLLALVEGETRVAGAVLCAPMLGLQTGKFHPLAARALTTFNQAIGRADRFVLGQPGAPYDDTFEGNALTHDTARFARYRAQVRTEPALALGAPTDGWLDFAIQATSRLAQPHRLSRVTVPVEIVSAAEDALVDNAAQAYVARNLPNGGFTEVSGAYHEILMETDDMRNIFLRVFDALTGKTAPTSTAPTAAPEPAPSAAAIVEAAPAPAPTKPKAPATAKATLKPKPAAKPKKTPAETKSAPAKAAPAKGPTKPKVAANQKGAAKPLAKAKSAAAPKDSKPGSAKPAPKAQAKPPTKAKAATKAAAAPKAAVKLAAKPKTAPGPKTAKPKA
jgi:lysophospholipase